MQQSRTRSPSLWGPNDEQVNGVRSMLARREPMLSVADAILSMPHVACNTVEGKLAIALYSHYLLRREEGGAEALPIKGLYEEIGIDPKIGPRRVSDPRKALDRLEYVGMLERRGTGKGPVKLTELGRIVAGVRRLERNEQLMREVRKMSSPCQPPP